MEGLTASVSFTGSVPRLRVTRHAVSPSASIRGEQDSLAQAMLELPNFKRPSTYLDPQTSEDEEIGVPGASSRLLSASLPPPDSSTHSGDTTHRLRALLNRFDNSSRNLTIETRVVVPPSTSELESDIELRPAQVARASIKDLFQNAMRESGDPVSRSSSSISNVELRERSKDNVPTLPTPDDSDTSLFDDESVPPPQMSTPTFKSVHLPDLSISPVSDHALLPPSPPSPVVIKRDPLARADADLARLQRAVAPNLKFPVRRSSPPSLVELPSVPILSTPSRQLPCNSPQESPSIASLEVPGARSLLVEDAKTPSKSSEEDKPSVSILKTPRFPGAFGTPGPPFAFLPAGDSMSYQDDVADEGETTPKIKAVDDLPATNPHTNAHTSATPAPPGAYRVAPTPAKRKGILKVRFNGNVQPPEDNTEDPFAGFASTGSGGVNGASPLSSSSEDNMPQSLKPLRPSRCKGLRLVDEYGRARRFTEDGEEIMLDPRRKTVNGGGSLGPAVPDDLTMTPRRRAKMRQVDAMGNEVTTAGSKSREANVEVPESRRKKAVLSRLTKSLEELHDDLAGEEKALAASVSSSEPGDNGRMLDLATVSKAARVERNKLSRKLQLERHAADGITDKIFVARNPLQPWETSDRTPWWQRKWRLVIFILILESTLLYIGYRVAMMHANHIWLKTYFDPFFPALYLHQSRPRYLSRFGSLPRSWSTFAISGSVQQAGVRGFFAGISKWIWNDVWSWRLEPWEAWGNPAAGPPVPRPWPS